MIYTFKQLHPAQPSNPRNDERELEDLLDTTQPGWRGEVVRRVFLPRIEASGALPTARGGGFGGRPGTQVPGVANLYLAGDWVGSAGFLSDASAASARPATIQEAQSTPRVAAKATDVVAAVSSEASTKKRRPKRSPCRLRLAKDCTTRPTPVVSKPNSAVTRLAYRPTSAWPSPPS